MLKNMQNNTLFLWRKDGGQYWMDLTKDIEWVILKRTNNKSYYEYKLKSNEKVLHAKAINVIYCEKGEYVNVNNYTFIDTTYNNVVGKDCISEAIRYIAGNLVFWKICKNDGSTRLYNPSELNAISPCIADFDKNSAFDYLKSAASLSEFTFEPGKTKKLLRETYDKISYIPEYSALAPFLCPEKYQAKRNVKHQPCIFPFGSNGSQLKAVNAAFENQISVIQGPPGTGKTQTILNVIANILVQGKTVLVVSGNNSAIQNVADKLKKDGLDFLTAKLGSTENFVEFLNSQNEKDIPTEVAAWNKDAMSLDELEQISLKLRHVFENNETIAEINHSLLELDTEESHFIANLRSNIAGDLMRADLTSEQLSVLLTKLPKLLYVDDRKLLSKLKKMVFLYKCRFLYGIKKANLCTDRLNVIITTAQSAYYKVKRNELLKKKEKCERENQEVDADSLLRTLTKGSMGYLKCFLSNTYRNQKRTIFSDVSELKAAKNARLIVEQYPVILSTTFSARCLKNIEYDYVIMDEASQISIETGALALSIGRNVVIVGDTKQLPTVITNEIKPQLELFFPKGLNKYYDSSKYSFLESIVNVLDGQIGSTLLREHYRCHPRIINFCNKKFYSGELVIMSQSNTNDTPLHVVRSVAGNHARGTVNLREAQIITDEVVERLAGKDVGIVTAYRDQVATIEELLKAKSKITKVDTVHKFQGQENDVIIMDYVADRPNDFVDDPRLMNVAISRAKDELYLVVTGNELPKDKIISDLIDYIEYNCGEIIESKIHSVFDILYTHLDDVYEKQMIKENVESPAELLMLRLVRDEILCAPEFEQLSVHTNYSLKNIFGKDSVMTDDERNFTMNMSAHTDLLIFNKLTNKPVLAIETDGYQFHYAETAAVQKERDKKKDSIFQKNGIPLLRCSTIDSGEQAKITNLLHKIMKDRKVV